MRKRWRPALILLVLCLILGAVRPAGAAEAPVATPHTFWDVQEVVQKATGSVVGVLAKFPPAREGGLSTMGSGTGVVYRTDGYIVTNAHVVYGATEVSVLMPDGKVVKAAQADVWTDYVSDVAVIRLPARTLKAPTWADSDQVKVGQLAIAVGNPLGFRLGNTVSVGVVSGLGRTVGTGYPFMQHDAAINSGNSGGPLLNADGQVMGINTWKIAGGSAEGLSFAIPSNVVKSIADTLIKEKKIARVWLGLTLYEGGLASYGLPTDEGLEVARVHENAPSYGQINKGDIIEAINGKAVHTLDDVSDQLKSVKAGQSVRLTLKRGTAKVEKTVTAEEMPNKPLDDEADSVRVAGVWRNMTEAQVEKAIEDGYNSLAKNFNKVAEKYIRKDAKAAVFFQTEYMQVLWAIWGTVRGGDDVVDGFEYHTVRQARGKFRVMFSTPKTTDKPIAGEGAATLTQGSIVVAGKSYHDEVMYGIPEFRPEGSEFTAPHWINFFEFRSEGFDLSKPVTLKIKSSEGVESTYTFDLKNLR